MCLAFVSGSLSSSLEKNSKLGIFWAIEVSLGLYLMVYTKGNYLKWEMVLQQRPTMWLECWSFDPLNLCLNFGQERCLVDTMSHVKVPEGWHVLRNDGTIAFPLYVSHCDWFSFISFFYNATIILSIVLAWILCHSHS
jgi:hypothetical protein